MIASPRAALPALLVLVAGCFEVAPAPTLPDLPEFGVPQGDGGGPRPDGGAPVDDARVPGPPVDAAPTSCEDDIDCPFDRYCQRGACIQGCRVQPDNCAPENNRPTACDPVPRSCRTQVPCCAEGACALVFEGTCAGTVAQANDCRDDPCRPRCATDAQCPEDTYCRTSDQRCVEGCRLNDPASCPRTETCDGTTRDCGPRACDEDADCPDFQLCDGGRCAVPCEDDAECGPDRVCGDEGRCTAAFACADDAREPDDTADTATPLAVERVAGLANLRVEQGILCGADADVFALDLQQGERFRLNLDTEGPLRLRVTGERLDAPLEGAEILFPDAGVIRPAGTYFVEVRALEGMLRTPYALDVAVAPASPGCFADAREPDDAPAEASRVPGDATVYAGTVCGSMDWMVASVGADDGLEIRVETVAGAPRLLVDLFAAADLDRAPTAQLPPQVVSNRIRHAFRVPPASELLEAGDYYLRVRPAEEGTAIDYTARMEVLEPSAICSSDVAEAATRNDRGEDATTLPAVVEGRRFVAEGLLCSSPDDVDWYAFEVASGGSRVCVMATADRPTDGDLDLGIYPEEPPPAGDLCLRDVQCDAGACIDGRCAAPIADATTELGAEMAPFRRGELLPGRRLLRVGRAAVGPELGYTVAVSVTPPAPCAPDWQERARLNDDPAVATELGDGAVALCDAWICQDERLGGDWYAVEVPAGEDRTVYVAFDRDADGDLRLDVSGRDAGVAVPDGDAQCLNLRGAAQAGVALVRVGAEAFVDGRDRLDYALRVVPTDLAVRPTGACALLGAAPLAACAPDAAEGDACWPTVEIAVDP